ncbi:MAG: LPXTG cell wall anchor domain-containing protein, partial [Desulfotomaculaceae bacterium]
LLEPNETWIYTSKMNLNATTTNTATAKGSANGMTATDIAFATVVVTPSVVVTTTVTGGQLPKTATPWYNVLLAGVALTLIGAVGWRSRKRYE